MIKRNLFYLVVISATICGIAINDAMSQVSNGRVTTASPSYTNNTTAPLSLNEDGELRITGNITATTEAEASAAAPTYSPGPNPLSQTLNGELRTINTPNGTQNVDVTATVGLTDAELRAAPVDVDVTATVGLTDTELRATPVPVSGTVAVSAIAGALPAGNNNIGGVDIISLPSIPAGVNAIGSISITPMSLESSSQVTSSGPAVIKGSAGTLYGLSAVAVSGGGFVDVFDNASACTGTIRFSMPLNANTATTRNITMLPTPIAFANGIVLCPSINSYLIAIYN